MCCFALLRSQHHRRKAHPFMLTVAKGLALEQEKGTGVLCRKGLVSVRCIL